MRIVGGTLRGRTLLSPRSQTIRPTTDRMRESLFNILEHVHAGVLDGARVLDLFAGTGALGFEALSRGASAVLFVEDGVEGRGLLRGNIEALGLTGPARIFRRDATRLGPVGTMKPFDLLFADPPYAKGLGEKALASAASGGWLVPGALCILEESAEADLVPPSGFDQIDERQGGGTVLHFFRFAG